MAKSCHGGKMFSLTGGRCTEQYMTSSHNTTLGFGDFDFQKISSYMVYTTSGPKRILIDHSNQRLRLKPGDLLGVRFPHSGPTAALKTSSSGSTLFYSSSMVNDTNSTTLKGNRFPITAESPAQVSFVPAIAFFYSVDSESKLGHVYQNIGHASVLTSIGNSITRVNDTKSICLQEDIKGLQLYFPEVFPFAEAVNVTGGITQGSNVTFYWNFGDKNNATSLVPWVEHVFNHTVGLKTVSIVAGNDIRVEAVWCTVLVQERIMGLQFKDTTLLPIENGTIAEIAWILPNGSHVDFTLNITYPGGFIDSKNLTNVKAPAATFFGKYNTTLTQPGWYWIEITASNRLNNVTLKGNLSVQRVVHVVSMDSPKILKTNQTFNFTIPSHQGDEIRYLLNTMDGKIINTTERLIPFVYTKAGRYDAYLIASNDISSVIVKCGKIIVQDVIEGLQFVSFIHTVAVNAQAEINWILTQGSELDIRVNYGDGSSTFVNRSVSVSDVFVAISKHNYSKPGEYLVIINVTNLVDTKEINTTVYVETPGTGGVLAIGRYNLNRAGNKSCDGLKLYIRVNDSVTATAKLKNGSNIYGYLDFGDNSSVRVRYFHREFPDDGWTERNIYSVAGEYYITTTFSNRNPGDVNQTCTVIVQNPVNVVMVTSDSPKKTTESVVNFTVSFPGRLEPSGPLRHQWRYGDGTSQDFVWDNRTKIHLYPNRCGVYIATVNVSNEISFGLGQTQVVVQDEVKDLKWFANYTKLKADYRGNCSDFVLPNNTFPFDHEVAFSAHADGTNVSYTWSFPSGVNKTNSSCKHKVKVEGKNPIVLTAENAVSFETINILLELKKEIKCDQIIVQDVIEGLQFVYPKILKTNQTFNFTIPPHQGDEIRYLLNTMDGNIINTTERLIPFVYTKAGRYDAYLIASNAISSVAVKCGQIIVQDMIEGLQFVSFIHTVAVNAQAEINWILTQGSELDIRVNYGDGSSTFVNRSVSVSDVFVAISKHNYSKPGEYLVIINVTNLVETKEINTTVYVETPCTGGVLAIGRYNLNRAGNKSCDGLKLYIRVNDSVTATAKLKNGSNIYGYLDFGDNSSVRVRYFHREFPDDGWTERNIYSVAGEYYITTTFSNRNPGDVNQNCTVIVQNPVNVVMVTSDSPKKTAERDVNFMVSFPGSLQPSGPLRYQWRYGDGTSQESDNRTKIHLYPNRCGVYIATVNVSNEISFGLGQTQVVVQDEVKDLKWFANYTKLKADYRGNCSDFVLPNNTFPFDHEVAFSAHADGTNVSYTWSFPSGVSKTNSSCKHKVKVEGKNPIVLTAENAVSFETINILLELKKEIKCDQIIVQDVIEGLQFVYPKILKTNQTFNFTIPPHQGDEIRYLLNTTDGNIINTTERLIPFVYTKAGRYDAYLIASNDISSVAVKCGQIIVQDVIEGLQFVSFNHTVAVNAQVEINWILTQGSELDIRVNCGDGSSTFVNRNVSVSDVFEAITKHNYSKPGEYLVIINVTNLVDSKEINTTVYVETPGNGGVLTIGRYNLIRAGDELCKEKILYVKVNDTVTATVKVKNGTNINGYLNFGDNSSVRVRYFHREFPEDGWTERNTYSVAGEYYITTTFSNRNPGDVNQTCKVIVQNPVNVVMVTSDSPKKTTESVVNFTVSFPGRLQPSGPLRYQWRYGDGTSQDFVWDNRTKIHLYPNRCGVYIATVNVSNEISFGLGQTQVVVQDEVKDLKWFANYTKLKADYRGNCSDFVLPNNTFPFDHEVAFSAHADGTNVSYTWSFPSGVNKTNSSCKHKVKVEGKNPIVLTAENAVSFETINILLELKKEIKCDQIIVKDVIEGLQFVYPKILKTNQTFNFTIPPHQGDEIRYLLNTTDGNIINTTERLIPFVYTKAGRYDAYLIASNDISSVAVKCGQIIVQDAIESLQFVCPKILKTNQRFNFTILLDQGDEIRYLLNTMDGNIINTTERLIPFVYTKAGRYDAYLNASNDISSVAVKCGQIIVQDVIEGLQFVSFNHTVAVNAQVEINWILTQGSELDIRVNCGDGSSTFVNRNVSVSDVFEAITKHNYSKPGEYLVIINVTNLVDSKEINTTVYVETPGNGGVLTIGRYNLIRAGDELCKEKILYVKVNDTVTATAKVKNGTNINGYLNFGDNSSVRVRYFHREFPEDGWTERNTYSVAGEYYITTTFSNRNPGDVNQTCKVIVQNPVNVVMVTSDSPKKTTESVVNFTVSFPGRLQPSGPLRYQWRYGDGTSQDFVWDNRTKIHLYPNRCGVYIATVNVSNQISFGCGETEVVVQDEVKDLKWFANYTKLNVDYSGECSDFPLPNNTFPFDHEVAFRAYANGTNVSYTWSFPSGINKINSSCTHKFETEGNNTIVLRAANAVSFETKNISLELEREIQNVLFVNDGPSTQNSLVNLTLTMTQEGRDSCFLIEFKETNFRKKKLKSPQSTGRAVEECNHAADEVTVVNKSQTFPVRYESVGEYPVSLYARNRVSCVYQVSEVAVARGLCKYPVISVPGFQEGAIRKFKRSEKISIKAHTVLNCFNYSTSLRWEILKKYDGQQQILDTQKIDVDRSELLIPAKFFDNYSEVEARFTVNMTEAPGVSKVKTVKFEIIESPLRAIIYGGSERTVGFDHLVEIDASGSYDPDATAGQDWNFTWFCHRTDDNYTLSANLTNLPPVPTAKPAKNWAGNDSKLNATNGRTKDLGGCFSFGPGRLNFPSLKITLNASKMTAGKLYVITFFMYKKGRETQNATQKIDVKFGDPPTLTIT